ncbi:MAG: glycosyltransferase family 39 protein [Chloroflexi bacterium]|nr:glycosyltransferase family 39 protein [Chloroflexota bacterium]
MTRPLAAAPLILALLAFALRVYALGRQSFWYDEGFSAYLASLPPLDALAYRVMDPHPPLHPWSLHVWTAIAGTSETALRFPSAIAGALAVLLIYRLAADLLGRPAGLIAGLLAAVNPFLIYYAQETRSYSYLLCFTLAATMVLLRQLRHPDDRPLAWAPYIALMAAALWSHYFALLTLAAHWTLAVAFWQWGKRSPWVWAAVQGVLGVLFAPWLALSVGVLTGYKTVGRGEAPAEMLRQTVTALADGGVHDLRFFTPAAGFLGIMIAAGLLAAPLLRAKPDRWAVVLTLLVGAAVPLFSLMAISLSRPTFHPRYLITAVPFALALAAAPAALAWSRLRPAGAALATLTVAVLLPALNTYYHDPQAARADYREAGAYLTQNAQPGDAVIYNAWYTQFIIDYYFHGPQDRYAPFHSGPLTEEQVVTELNRLAPGHRRLWLVLWQDDSLDPGRQLSTVVRRGGALIGERWLGELRIFGYSLPETAEPPFRVEGIPQPMKSGFGGEVDLLGYRLEEDKVRAGDHLRVGLFWQARQRLTEDYVAFVHVMTLDPRVVAQQDRPAGGNYQPTSRWEPGATVSDEFFFPVPADTPPGEYYVEAGLYRAGDMRRLKAEGDGLSPDGTSILLPRRVTVLPR